jgi:hypothetical protein
MARGWRLTVRYGSEVDRESFDTAEQAIAELERRAETISSEGPLEPVAGFRDYQPGEQVAARFEVSGPRGLRRGREAGLDVMGDGRLVAYTGSILKRVLDRGHPIDALREELAGG